MTYDGKTNYINGKWAEAQDGRTFASMNPADSADTLGQFARSAELDVDSAVKAAAAAFPKWKGTPAPVRGALLTRMGRLLERDKETLSQLMTREMGKVLTEARGDVQEAIDMAFYMAAFGRLPDGHTVGSERADVFCMARRVPMGVAGLVTPWNFPVAIPAWKMFPALLAGNTVVFKPAEDTPALAVEFVKLLQEAGVPEGVVNLVTGFGEEAGAALVEHPGVGVISFTGSTQTGRTIAGRCGQLLKRVSCELGGKNAIVVLDDANLELAVKGALWSAFGTAGQRCTAASRLIVQKGVKKEFTEMLVEQTRRLRMGAGADDNTQIGPVVNRSQLNRIHDYVQIGKQEGATVLTGGTILEDGPYAKGSFYAPTVFDNMELSMRVAQEEIFGPVTGLVEVGTVDDALSAANATRYGLSLSLYTHDVTRAFRAIDALDAGIVYINLPTSGAEIQLPFGGVKDTGNGHREAGAGAMDYCTEWKSVYVNYSPSDDLVRAQIDVTV